MNAYFAIDKQHELDGIRNDAYETWEENLDLVELAECIDLDCLLWAVLKHDKAALNDLSVTLNARLEERWQAHLKDCEDASWDAAIDDYEMAGCF